MFSPSFLEGQRLLVEDCPIINLEEDDPELMELMFRILHYQGSPQEYVMDAEKLARLSLQCDKYQCTRALGPWVTIWLRNVARRDDSARTVGFQILAAYTFGDLLEFRSISRTATLQLRLSFVTAWDEDNLLAILPPSVSGKP